MGFIYAVKMAGGVLSSIFFSPEVIEDILGILRPKDF